MKDVPLHSHKDEKWALKGSEVGGNNELVAKEEDKA